MPSNPNNAYCEREVVQSEKAPAMACILGSLFGFLRTNKWYQTCPRRTKHWLAHPLATASRCIRELHAFKLPPRHSVEVECMAPLKTCRLTASPLHCILIYNSRTHSMYGPIKDSNCLHKKEVVERAAHPTKSYEGIEKCWKLSIL